MKLIFKLLKPYKKTLSWTLILKALGTSTDLVIPFIISYIIDLVKDSPEKPSEIATKIILYGILMIFLAAFGFTLNVIANRKAEYIASYATYTLRHDMFTKIMNLSSKQIDKITTPSLISRMTTDTYTIFQSTASLQRMGIRAPILLLTGIIISLIISPLLSTIMIALLPIILIVSIVISKKTIPLYQTVQTKTDKTITILRENITGARIIKALSTTDYEISRFDKANIENMETSLKATYSIAKTKPIMDVLMNLGLVFAIMLGAYQLFNHLDGSITSSMLLNYVTIFTIILNAMLSVTRIFTMISKAQASSNRINEVLDLDKDIISGTVPYVVKDELPIIEFKNVSFSYNEKVNNLENINFKLYKGQSLGIIGPTGSGKTTLINLLMRFYDTDQGEINIFGINIKDINLKQYRKKVGLVLQNDSVFSKSIMHNITFDRKRVDELDYLESIEIAQADFIKDMILSNEDKTLTQRGTNVSGGQKQRILVSRALAGHPDLLILDDASSALDYKTDQKMREAIKQKLPNITKIVIAQRISSIKDCDLILLIEDGHIIVSGTHSQLKQESKFYRTLILHQLGSEHL